MSLTAGAPTTTRVITPGDPTTTVVTTSVPPLLDGDRTQAPPVRIHLGTQTIDLAGVGCWSTPVTVNPSRSMCNEHFVDPTAAVLAGDEGGQLGIEATIPAHLTVKYAPTPPPLGPGRVATGPIDRLPLTAHPLDDRHWALDIPQHSGPIAIYIGLFLEVADAPPGVLGTDTSYGFEVQLA